jgi:hypothetical protein
MVHTRSSGSAVMRGNSSAASKLTYDHRVSDGGSNCLAIGRRRLPTAPAARPSISPSHGRRYLPAPSASGTSVPGPDGDSPGGATETWQQRAGGGRSGYRWTSTSTATGSFRGSYEDFSELPQDGDAEEAEGPELGGPVRRVMALGTAAALELLLTGGARSTGRTGWRAEGGGGVMDALTEG